MTAGRQDHKRVEIHAKIQEHLGEYEQLPLVTLALEMEINAYPKLLQTEQEELKLFLRSSFQVTTPGACFPFITLPQPQNLFALRRLIQTASTHSLITVVMDQTMVAYEMIQSTGNPTAPYKFPPKYSMC